MKPEEANRIIAEFMIDDGLKGGIPYDLHSTSDNNIHWKNTRNLNSCWHYDSPNYSKSIDALISVWEKLNVYRVNLRPNGTKADDSLRLCGIRYKNNTPDANSDNQNTIQEAAAIATAKAILELKGEE